MTHNFKHFSYILEKNTILSIGRNNPDKTHPLAYRFNHRFNCIHSELSAIVNFDYPHKRLHNCKIINIRITESGRIAMSRPCINCQTMLSAFGLKDVVYSNRDGNFERLRH